MIKPPLISYEVTILFAIKSQSGDPSCREKTAETRPSISISAGIPPKDASSDGAASLSKARSEFFLSNYLLSYNLYKNFTNIIKT